jgi:hypothetical protein
MFGDCLYLKEGPSSTLSARIMCPALAAALTFTNNKRGEGGSKVLRLLDTKGQGYKV